MVRPALSLAHPQLLLETPVAPAQACVPCSGPHTFPPSFHLLPPGLAGQLLVGRAVHPQCSAPGLQPEVLHGHVGQWGAPENGALRWGRVGSDVCVPRVSGLCAFAGRYFCLPSDLQASSFDTISGKMQRVLPRKPGLCGPRARTLVPGPSLLGGTDTRCLTETLPAPPAPHTHHRAPTPSVRGSSEQPGGGCALLA